MKVVVSVYDKKADCCNGIAVFNSKGEAVRAFCDLLKDSKTVVGTHPADFRLLCVGQFDDESGHLTGYGCDYSVLADGQDFAGA